MAFDSAADYVIIGAGSAGCVLAHRLSEDPGTRVLLLEAGGPDKAFEIQVPVAFAKLFKTENDWAYYTEPQLGCFQRRLFWPRGKVLGGSSSINAMVYIRGHASDYDAWAAAGNEGWSYQQLLPFFKKAENQGRGPDAYHGVGGPLDVNDQRHPSPLSAAFIAAARGRGLAANRDFNGAEQDGVGLYQVTQRGGSRCSTAVAYLRPALARPNLEARTHAQVTRIIIEDQRARGVELRHAGQTLRVEARREVILCGGAINSPQLLLLSGVGAREELEPFDIPCLHELPGVGRELQDHLAYPIVYRCPKKVSLMSQENLLTLFRYLLFRGGPGTSNAAEAGGFIRTRDGLEAPDLQYHFVPGFFTQHAETRFLGDGFSLGPTILRPKSRGTIRLASADPLAAAAIDPRYLSEDEDLALLAGSLGPAREIIAHAAFDGLRSEELMPGGLVEDEEEIRAAVRRTVETLYHPVGSCAMGPEGSGAVVDARLRVHGLAGLRVIDASIMPSIVAGNTNAPVIAIAEKGAQLLKEDASSLSG